jgi:hypothetical protein
VGFGRSSVSFHRQTYGGKKRFSRSSGTVRVPRVDLISWGRQRGFGGGVVSFATKGPINASYNDVSARTQ